MGSGASVSLRSRRMLQVAAFPDVVPATADNPRGFAVPPPRRFTAEEVRALDEFIARTHPPWMLAERDRIMAAADEEERLRR